MEWWGTQDAGLRAEERGVMIEAEEIEELMEK
jgi:hypothetical protein